MRVNMKNYELSVMSFIMNSCFFLFKNSCHNNRIRKLLQQLDKEPGHGLHFFTTKQAESSSLVGCGSRRLEPPIKSLKKFVPLLIAELLTLRINLNFNI